jgi:hypothetical protein
LLDAPVLARHGQLRGPKPTTNTTPPHDAQLHGHAVTLRFVKAAATARILADEPTAERRNYFLGSDAKHWAHDVRGFRQLRYAGLWPGIDARVYESADQQLEYDFELAPGANPAAIVLRHDGADAVQLDAAGSLHIKTSVGSITERAPQAWQADAAGQHQPVPCRYQLAPDGTVRFALGQYDAKRPLTIDPVVVFSTYSGSFADNWGCTSTYDAQGNLYSGGIAFAVGFPVSPGAFHTSIAGLVDIALIKYNTAASGPAARVWATYLGGSSSDFPASLVVNSQGELLVLGTTSSTSSYPTTTAAIQHTLAGGTPADPYGYGDPILPNGSDLVITRFNTTGSALVASTYLGGTGNDGLLPLNVGVTSQLAHNYGDPFRGDILTDAADNVYIATNTASTTFPMAGGFANTYRGGATDGLVLKLNPTLTALTWGSYLGGAAADAAYSIQLEPTSGDVYVAGGTLSANFPATAGSLRTTAVGDVDGFVARIAANGTSLLRATYLGTSSYDQSYFLQLGSDGGVYVLGQTAGNYPTTTGLYRNANGRQFIHKLDANLATTQLATVFGTGRPTIDLDPTAFLVDQCDRVYVCGWGGGLNAFDAVRNPELYLSLNGPTTGLPTTPGAVQPTTDGGDFYLAQFSAGLTNLDYATFYGSAGDLGDHVDGGTSRFDPRGAVYQAVCSCGNNTGFPIPPGANTYSATNNTPTGFCNNAAFSINFLLNNASAGTDQTVCATAGPLPLVGSPAGGTWSGPGVTGSVATGFVFTPSLALLGTQALTYAVTTTGICGTTSIRRITVLATPVPPVLTSLPALCVSTGPQPLVATPAGGTWSGPGVSGSAGAGYFFGPGLGAGTYQLTYTVGASPCLATAALSVSVFNALNVTVPADTALCPGSIQPFRLRASLAGGAWTGPGVTGSLAAGYVFTPPAGFAGPASLVYTVGNSGCTGTATRRVSVAAVPGVVPTWLPEACPETRLTPLTLRFRLPASGTPYMDVVWEFGDGGQSGETSPLHTYTAVGTYQPRLRIRYNQGRCETQVALPVVEVKERKIPNIITPNGDSQNETFRLGPDCPPRLQVFSRWGQKVFESATYHDEWNAEGQPSGVYHYLLSYPDGHRVKGWVEVRR